MLADYRHHRLLTHDEDIALARRVRAGDRAAADELALHNVRLVHKQARHFFSTDPAVDYDDLVAAGLAGLARAINKYDPARGTRFSTYAVWWIRQSIRRLIATTGQISRPGHSADSMKSEAYREAHHRSRRPLVELDAPLLDRKGIEGDTLADLIAASETSVEDQVFTRIEAERLFAALNLNERGQAIISDWLSGLTRAEAQEMHGVSHSWISSTLKNKRQQLESFMSRQSASPNCIEPGCDQPRMVSSKGITLPRCEQHQRAYWNAAAAARRQRDIAAAERVADASHQREAVPTPTPASHEHYVQQAKAAAEELQRSRPSAAPVPPLHEGEGTGVRAFPPPSPPAVPNSELDHSELGTCDCAEDCLYRTIVELLAAKNPRIAELVQVMQTARRLRDELGI